MPKDPVGAKHIGRIPNKGDKVGALGHHGVMVALLAEQISGSDLRNMATKGQQTIPLRTA